MTTHINVLTKCPTCGHEYDAASSATTDNAPIEDDFCVCSNCCGVHRFGPGMVLRHLSEADILQLPLPELRQHQIDAAVHQATHRRN